MQLEFSKEFDKQFKKLNSKQQLKVEGAIKQFIKDKSVASLRLHALKGEWKNHFSISAGGDLRIHLKYIENRMFWSLPSGHIASSINKTYIL